MDSPSLTAEWNESFEEMHGELENEFTFLQNVSHYSPLDWALPLYGYLMPILVATTAVTNTFVIIVLSQKHLRTPTNAILLAMAVADLLTGYVSCPWFIYYYTLQGYQYDDTAGISAFWCHAYGYMIEIFPSVFHTAAIWLAAYLAIQRYIYVCVPNHVNSFCTPKTTKYTISIILAASFVTSLPDLIVRRRFSHLNSYNKRLECYIEILGDLLKYIQFDVYHSLTIWSRVILHTIPMILLLIFTCKLGSTLKEAETRKKSFAATHTETNGTQGRNGSKGGRSLYATNRMLAMICSVFLLLEIPAAILHAFQFIIAMNWFHPGPNVISHLNRGLIVRNLLIVLTSPIQFAIYCSMSEQFRLTVRQLFTTRLLFFTQAQATFHGGKRYSLVLIDVDYEDIKPGTTGMRCFAFLNKKGNCCFPRKVGRQTFVVSCENRNNNNNTNIQVDEEIARLQDSSQDELVSLHDSTMTSRLKLSEGASSV